MRKICTSRFDEGEVETECWGDTRAPATERAGNTQGFPTLPRHLRTLLLPKFIRLMLREYEIGDKGWMFIEDFAHLRALVWTSCEDTGYF
jgi:hypothetical protein